MSEVTPEEITFVVTVASHVGRVRVVQQDAIAVSGWVSQDPDGTVKEMRPTDRWPTVVLADGLGGHPAGELASRIAVEVVSRPGRGESLDSLAAEAHDRIVAEAARTGNLGMGTTIAVVALRPDGIHLANVGDSSIYETTAELFKLSVDDHLDGAGKTDSSTVTQALGIGNGVQPHISRWPVEEGLQFLLCSDGLTVAVSDERIAEIVAREPYRAGRVERLVEEALAAGAPDNISVAIVDVILRSEVVREEMETEATVEAEVDVPTWIPGPAS